MSAFSQQLMRDPLAILTLGLLVITAYYAILTDFQLRVSRESVEVIRKQNLIALRPYVTVRPAFDNGLYLLQIENTGRTAACDLQLSCDSQVLYFNDLKLSDHALFEDGVDSFAPGTEVNFMLGHKIQRDGDDRPFPPRFKITAQYGHAGNEFSETTTVDFDQFPQRMLLHVGADGEAYKSRKALETIADSVS